MLPFHVLKRNFALYLLEMNNLSSNIGDLISYIEYNNFEIIQSEIYSIFDYLYQQYTAKRIDYLKKHKRISEFDSVNLAYGMIKDLLIENQCTTLGVVTHQPLNTLLRNLDLMSEEQRVYAMNPLTHIDLLIYSKISKKPVLAIEVDGYEFHNNNFKQEKRDIMKDNILNLFKIPMLRLATNESGEKEKILLTLKKHF